MSVLEIESTYDPEAIPAQAAFRRSKARITGYGGALGGGKSRTLCELAFDYMLDSPGIMIGMLRQVHTSITLTTRKTFVEQVLPPQLRARKDLIREIDSQGKDFVEFLWNGSQLHFIGLDNPMKLFSSEFGAMMFDEAQEISEQDVITAYSRVRQRCRVCITAGIRECEHMPHRMHFAFNPSFPGHWLDRWFRLGAQPTEYGFRRDTVHATDAEDSLGDMEFFKALPTDNPFVSERYIAENLAGMPPDMKRRYLLGEWIHVGGAGFFDAEAMERLRLAAELRKPVLVGEPIGDLIGKDKADPPRFRSRETTQPLEVYVPPVRLHVDKQENEVKAHRYVLGVDASSGMAADYSAIQVIDVEELEQVAQWQGKVDPDQLAETAFRIACVYNGALLAPEITGGWGFAVTKRLQRLTAGWQGSPAAKPRIYTRPVVDRLSQRFTDLVGFDTNTKTRALMLDALEQSVRDGSLQVNGVATIVEMDAFAFRERRDTGLDFGSPRARSGAHDDLVIALAIGVYVATRQPRQTRPVERRAEPVYMKAAGY